MYLVGGGKATKIVVGIVVISNKVEQVAMRTIEDRQVGRSGRREVVSKNRVEALVQEGRLFFCDAGTTYNYVTATDRTDYDRA